MNVARWIATYHSMVEQQRRDVRRWARFFGSDMTVFQKDEEGNPIKSEIADIFPLAGILNPEVYKELTERYQITVKEDEIDKDQFEKQMRELEESGALTDIDILTDAAEKKMKEKKDKHSELSFIGVKEDPNT